MSKNDHPLGQQPVQETVISLLEGLATTRAIRRYRNEPIPAAHLRDMLFSATRAPSGSNRQPFRFIVLTDGEKAAQAKALIAQAAQDIWTEKERSEAMVKARARIQTRQNLVWRAPCAAT